MLPLQGKVTYFCINQTAGNATIPELCEEPTQDDINLFTSSMAACFQSAVDAGLGISISPHLDDGFGLGEIDIMTVRRFNAVRACYTVSRASPVAQYSQLKNLQCKHLRAAYGSGLKPTV